MTETSYTPFRLPPDTTPDARFDALEEALAQAAMALDAGQVQRLDGVDDEVRVLCTQIAEMPAAQAMPYIEKLQNLHAAFTALGEATAAEQGAVRDELGNLSARHKAHRAYGMQSGLPKDDGEEQS